MSSITEDSSGTYPAKINSELNLSSPPYVFNLVSFYTFFKETEVEIYDVFFLEDGRFVISWSNDSSDVNDKNVFKVYDPSNNFHVDITVTLPDDEIIMNIINVDKNTLIVSSIIPKKSEVSSEPIKYTLFYKVIKLSKDTYTMNSYKIQENVIRDNVHYFTMALKDKKFASMNDNSMINIWSAEEPFNTTPITTIELQNEKIISSYYNKKGNLLVLSNKKDKLMLIDLNLCKLIKTIQNEDIVNWFLYDYDEAKMIANKCTGKETLNYFYYDTEKLETLENINMKECNSLMVLRDGNLLLQCDKNKFIVYDVKNGKWSMSIFHENKFKYFYYINDHSFATVDSNSIYIWKY